MEVPGSCLAYMLPREPAGGHAMRAFVFPTRSQGVRRVAASPVGWLVAGGLVGTAAMYFLDPVLGKLRRNVGRDVIASRARRLARLTIKQARWRIADAYGLSQRVAHMQPEQWSVPNDETLAQRVESELFSDPRMPKGAINVNAEAGIVVLRGQIAHQSKFDPSRTASVACRACAAS